jgi:hypothetical protein
MIVLNEAMMMLKVLNRHTDVVPPGSIYCGRGSPYGNPFVIGQWWEERKRVMTRDDVCDRFESEVLPTLDVSLLRGKNLVCFCKPRRCHCDPILIKANLL